MLCDDILGNAVFAERASHIEWLDWQTDMIPSMKVGALVMAATSIDITPRHSARLFGQMELAFFSYCPFVGRNRMA